MGADQAYSLEQIGLDVNNLKNIQYFALNILYPGIYYAPSHPFSVEVVRSTQQAICLADVIRLFLDHSNVANIEGRLNNLL